MYLICSRQTREPWDKATNTQPAKPAAQDARGRKPSGVRFLRGSRPGIPLSPAGFWLRLSRAVNLGKITDSNKSQGGI
jgi:hypothetical protein